MKNPIKIMHIDPDFKVTYFIKKPGAIIRSLIPLKQAIELLKTEEFDLILSEPHNRAILKPQNKSNGAALERGLLAGENEGNLWTRKRTLSRTG